MGGPAESRSADVLAPRLERALADLTKRLAYTEARNEALQHECSVLRAECADLHSDREAIRRAYAEAKEQTARAAAALVQARDKERAGPRLALPDAGAGYASLRPDPRGVQTPAELTGRLRQFRLWAGNPSYREMARRSGRRAGASTMCKVLGSDELPGRLEVIDAIVEGCGGSDEDRQKFATAWRLLTMVRSDQAAVSPGTPSPPRLRLVSS